MKSNGQIEPKFKEETK